MLETRNDKLFKGASGDPRVTAGKAFSLADECRRLLAHMDAPLKCIQKVPRESFDVERGHVIASEALAKYARRTQESKITDHLEDDVIRGMPLNWTPNFGLPKKYRL
ncbi:hypothetical protein QJS10_CPB14g00499 [Acorus calamus]|uniref:Uncharacterized protein n=1 Tax=Acorus calamus TaxID=4465 RepID=A0AAV9DBG7_ACOCL|nr:hypothetical protein QJS10_CPB14g00499 [Acorus calamus]